jgi:hypothetical protein
MRARLLPVALVVVPLSLSPRPVLAEADKKAECAAAYEASQELRTAGRLTAAEEKLVVCADEACPSFVRSDCATWLEEVRRDLPSLRVTARDAAGEETTKVRVLRGEDVLAEELTAGGITLDPGTHELRFELEGSEPIVKEITLEKGDKGHALEIRFAGPGAAEPAAPPPSEVPLEPAPEAADDAGEPGPLRPYAYVAGGVGAAGLIGWAVLGAIGKGEENDLRDTCSPSCTKSQVDGVETKYLLADISLGVGIVGLGAGVALFFLSQPKGDDDSEADAGQVDVDVRATSGGGFATVSGRF